MWDNATITMLLEGTRDTLYMTLVSTFFGYVLGLPLGILLAVTDKEGIRPNAPLYKVLDVIVNILRSIPFLILLILVIPLTKLIVGQSYGSSATIVPLVIAAAPFIARMVESSLKEVEPGVIEAAVSMGAGTGTIIWKVLLAEARTSLLVGLPLQSERSSDILLWQELSAVAVSVISRSVMDIIVIRQTSCWLRS